MDDVPRVAEAGSVHHLEDGTRIQIMHNGLRVLADGYYGDWNIRRIEFLFVSTHYFGPELDPLIHQRCLALILNCGGKIIAEHDIHESFSCDGLIVAYFGDDPQKATPVPVSFNRYSQTYFRNPLYDVAIMRRRG
jgi:hypothetical protein